MNEQARRGREADAATVEPDPTGARTLPRADESTPSDYSKTLYLPQTDFPMRAGLPKTEPELLARWQEIDLFGRLCEAGRGRPKFVLHDGPP